MITDADAHFTARLLESVLPQRESFTLETKRVFGKMVGKALDKSGLSAQNLLSIALDNKQE